MMNPNLWIAIVAIVVGLVWSFFSRRSARAHLAGSLANDLVFHDHTDHGHHFSDHHDAGYHDAGHDGF